METNKLSILIDSDALVAMMKPDDENRDLAFRTNQWLEESKAELFLSPFTIPETVTVLSYRVNHEVAKSFLVFARNFAYTTLELVDPIAKEADKWFSKQTKKRTSYFDCANLAFMEVFGFDAIFSFDKVYRKNGFKFASDLI